MQVRGDSASDNNSPKKVPHACGSTAILRKAKNNMNSIALAAYSAYGYREEWRKETRLGFAYEETPRPFNKTASLLARALRSTLPDVNPLQHRAIRQDDQQRRGRSQ